MIQWRRFFAAIQFDTGEDEAILCDNQQTIRILQKEAPKLITKLKHVDIHSHWLRQEVQANSVKLEWIPTADMPADGLTKPLSVQKHSAFIKQLNLVDISTKLVLNRQSECE
jgi:molybdopterin converting factor small subunit